MTLKQRSRRHVAPVPPGAEQHLQAQFEQVFRHSEARKPWAGYVTDEDTADYAREVALRLFRSGTPLMLGLIDNFLESSSDEEFKAMFCVALNITPTKHPRGRKADKVRVERTCDAFNFAQTLGKDEQTALQAAYDAYWGEGMFLKDSQTECDRPGSKSKDFGDLSTYRMNETIRPLLSTLGFELTPIKPSGRPRTKHPRKS